MSDFDVIVIGAGPAGEVLAGRTAAAGLSTAIVEERLVGGECGFYACMPSKALLHPGEILDETRRVPGAREATDGRLDVQAVFDNRDSLISDLDDSTQVPWLEDNDISLYRGHGRITGDRRVVVGDEELFARIAVVIAIGSEPTLPEIEGLSEANPWTNREATTSKVVPGRLLVIGGGVVGAEMAQAYTSLGAKVTVLERGTQLLAKEEPWAAEQVAARLREQGVEILLEVDVTKVDRPGGTGDYSLAATSTITAAMTIVEDCRRVSWAATALGAPRVCQAWSSRLGMTMRVPVFRALATAWAVSRRRALRRRRWGLGASGRGFAGGLRRRD